MVSKLLLEANGWSRPRILAELNDVLDILLQNQTEQTVKTVNGEFPTITTTTGQRQYSADDDVWRISEILIAYPTAEYGILWSDLYGNQANIQAPIEDRYYNGKRYTLVQPIKTIDAIGSTPVQVIFRFDPGSRDYYYRGYLINAQLNSESVDIPLPNRLRTKVYAATIAMINGYQNGNILEAEEYVRTEIKPLIDKEQNEGAQGESCFAEPRRA